MASMMNIPENSEIYTGTKRCLPVILSRVSYHRITTSLETIQQFLRACCPLYQYLQQDPCHIPHPEAMFEKLLFGDALKLATCDQNRSSAEPERVRHGDRRKGPIAEQRGRQRVYFAFVSLHRPACCARITALIEVIKRFLDDILSTLVTLRNSQAVAYLLDMTTA